MENMNNCCNYSAGSSMVRDALLIWMGEDGEALSLTRFQRMRSDPSAGTSLVAVAAAGFPARHRC